MRPTRAFAVVAAVSISVTFPPPTMISATPTASTSACQGLNPTIVGTDGPDTITGTPGADVINALAGDDVVRGLGGDDVICGGAGNDTIDGGAGNDRLSDTEGVNVMRGGAGADRLVGGGPSNIRDVGGDVLVGGSGNDVLTAEPDPNRYLPYGNELWPGTGRDVVNAGRQQIVHGWIRPDVVIYDDAPRGVEVNLLQQRATGAGVDRLRNVARVIGSRHDDRIIGDAGANDLSGGLYQPGVTRSLGADVIRGGGADDVISSVLCAGGATLPTSPACAGATAALARDVLSGGPGNDQLVALAGTSTVEGGPGADDVKVGQGRVQANGGDGRDKVWLFGLGPTSGNVTGGGRTTCAADECGNALRFGAFWSFGVADPGPVTVDLAAGTARGRHINVTIEQIRNVTGTPQGDVLIGSAQRDRLYGWAGDDTLRGRGGDDFLNGGSGSDTVWGGEGTDSCGNAQSGGGCETSWGSK